MTAPTPVESGTPAKSGSTIRERLVAFAELRDAVLFISSALYVCGYLTWAAYAADRGLGILPPLEGQYFVAGVVPLMVGVLAVVFLKSLGARQNDDERQRAAKVAERWIAAGGLLFAVSFAATQLALGPAALSNAVLVLGVILVYVASFFAVRAGGFAAGPMRLALRIGAVAVPFVGGLAYATRAFPNLPAELGGPSRMCIQLDLVRASLSSATLALLADDRSEAAAVRTRPIWLQFVGGGVFIVSLREGRPSDAVVRLRENIVTAVTRSEGCS